MLNIASGIVVIIFMWSGVILMTSGDMTWGSISIVSAVIFVAILADTKRRNTLNPPPPEVERRTQARGESLAVLLIIALVYLAVVLIGRW